MAGRAARYRRGVSTPTPTGPVTTLHLFGVAPADAVMALSRMALDRGPLRRTPGLQFFKLVGTGSGRTFTVRDADPTRWGLIGVWDRPASLAAFERQSPVMRAWLRFARESWRIDLRAVRSRGRWSGREPFWVHGQWPDSGMPVAALTRARIDWRRSSRFWAAVPPVASQLAVTPGLRFSIGFGEAPVGLQGTFSVWDSAAALSDFAYGGRAHREAISETSRLQWYREELFARFAVLGSHGTVGGVDPLRDRAIDA